MISYQSMLLQYDDLKIIYSLLSPVGGETLYLDLQRNVLKLHSNASKCISQNAFPKCIRILQNASKCILKC